MEFSSIEDLRRRYLAERVQYEELASVVAERIESLTIMNGIRCDVHWRAKEISSFLKKVLKRKYSDPYMEIRDKAGVRVIAHYPWDIARIEELVQETFTICHHEDKRVGVSFQTLDYRGTHFEVKYDGGPVESCDLLCEIQVLTKAESLWADTAHYLSYKPAQPPSELVQRGIYRLIALVELFDSEVKRAYDALCSDDGYEEARLLHVLEQHYLKFTAKQGDRELSLELLSLLTKVVNSKVVEQFEASMEDFVSSNREKLTELYERYQGDDLANPLIWQPETLLVFLQLETDAFRLKDVWQEELPVELLMSLADAWGTPI